MKIYEINQEIESLLQDVDGETGEIRFDPEKLAELQLERDQKVENLALAVKNLTAEAKAIGEEAEALSKRKKAAEKAAARAKDYLEFVLQGEKFQTAKVAVSYRKSTKVGVEPGFLAWAQENRTDLLRYKNPEADRVAIGAALKNGDEIPYAQFVTETSMTIK